MSTLKVIERATRREKFCWTCGDIKDVSRFSVDTAQHDGLSAECVNCEDGRNMARAMDGETGPRTYPIEGEGRKKAPHNYLAADATRNLNAALRARPTSGLMSQDTLW